MNKLHEVMLRCRDMRRIGSAALDMCAVAAGRLDAYYEQGIHVWDIAAATLIVREAGGVVCDPYGGDCSKVCWQQTSVFSLLFVYFLCLILVEFVWKRCVFFM